MISIAGEGVDPRQVAAVVIFVLTYAGLAMGHWFFFKLDRTGIALLGAIAMLACGCVNLPEAIAKVNAASLCLLFALMLIAAQLHFAGFYSWIANKALNRALDRPALFLAVLMILSGTLSAFLNNDVVVLALSPVVCVVLLQRGFNPVPFLIALALASNIGCALTTIGNAQNVLIGQIGHLRFLDYMRFSALPVSVSLAACYGIVYWLGRKEFRLPRTSARVSPVLSGEPPFNRWLGIKGMIVLAVVVVLFVFGPLPHYLVAMAGAGILLCSHIVPSRKMINMVNWQLLLLFTSLFIVVGAFLDSGVGDFITRNRFVPGNPEEVAVTTAVLSNCINNSAAVMLLIKTCDLTSKLNCYALAMSNAFAGNLILLGSLANIIAVQSAQTFGVRISFREFSKYGAPTAVVSMGVLLGWLRVFGG